MSRMSDGARALWEEMQRDAAPDCQVLRVSFHRARKGGCYRCGNCGLTLHAGECYRYEVVLIDGEFTTFVAHRVCP